MTDAAVTSVPFKTLYNFANGYAPAEGIGPRGVYLKHTFEAAGTQEGDLVQDDLTNRIQIIQTAWISNPTSQPVTVRFPDTQFNIIVPPQSQGFYGVLATPPHRYAITAGAAGVIEVQLLNVPIAQANWSMLYSPGGGGSGGTANWVDVSGTIAFGGTSQPLAPANASRTGLFIENVSAGDLWFNFGVAAVIAQPSIRLGPGENFFLSSPDISPLAVFIIGATTAQAFTAKVW